MSDPFQWSVLVSSLQHLRERFFLFTEQLAIFRAYLFNFCFEVGGWTDAKLWEEASAVGYISLLREHLFDFRWVTKGLCSLFLKFVLLLSYCNWWSFSLLRGRNKEKRKQNQSVCICSHAVCVQWQFHRPPTKIQEQWEIPQVIPLNVIAEEELRWPDFSWLNRTYGGIGKID